MSDIIRTDLENTEKCGKNQNANEIGIISDFLTKEYAMGVKDCVGSAGWEGSR